MSKHAAGPSQELKDAIRDALHGVSAGTRTKRELAEVLSRSAAIRALTDSGADASVASIEATIAQMPRTCARYLAGTKDQAA